MCVTHLPFVLFRLLAFGLTDFYFFNLSALISFFDGFFSVLFGERT